MTKFVEDILRRHSIKIGMTFNNPTFNDYIESLTYCGRNDFYDLRDNEVDDLLSLLLQAEQGVNGIDFILETSHINEIGLLFARVLGSQTTEEKADRLETLVLHLREAAIEKYRDYIDEALERTNNWYQQRNPFEDDEEYHALRRPA